MNFLTAVSRQMTRFTALIIVLASIIAFIEPANFSWVKGDTQVVVLGIIMLGMGMTLGKEDYQILAQRPLDIFIGAIAQYTIMPLLAIGIAKAVRDGSRFDAVTGMVVLVGYTIPPFVLGLLIHSSETVNVPIFKIGSSLPLRL